MAVSQAYRFALDPSPAQERCLRSHAGAARFAWNWGLARCKERYEAERKWYSSVDLHRLWNAAKKADPDLAWWAENSKCVYQESFRDLERGLKDFVRSRKGERKGKRLGFPRFKKRGRCRDSFRFSTGAIRCAGRTVTLPRLGAIRTYESTRKLARRVENGTARIVSATVSRTAQRWFVSFTVVVDRAIAPRHPWPGSAIGVDLGVRTLVTGVDDRGSVIEICGPKPLSLSLRRLRRASRAHSRTQDGSENRRKSAGRLARIHARVAYVRADALHKATSELSVRYETVVAEDLNVALAGPASAPRPVPSGPGVPPSSWRAAAAWPCSTRPADSAASSRWPTAAPPLRPSAPTWPTPPGCGSRCRATTTPTTPPAVRHWSRHRPPGTAGRTAPSRPLAWPPSPTRRAPSSGTTSGPPTSPLAFGSTLPSPGPVIHRTRRPAHRTSHPAHYRLPSRMGRVLAVKRLQLCRLHSASVQNERAGKGGPCWFRWASSRWSPTPSAAIRPRT